MSSEQREFENAKLGESIDVAEIYAAAVEACKEAERQATLWTEAADHWRKMVDASQGILSQKKGGLPESDEEPSRPWRQPTRPDSEPTRPKMSGEDPREMLREGGPRRTPAANSSTMRVVEILRTARDPLSVADLYAEFRRRDWIDPSWETPESAVTAAARRAVQFGYAIRDRDRKFRVK